MHYIITFRYGNYTMAAYSRLQNLGFKNIKLASVPFAIKTECDLCIVAYDYYTLLDVLDASYEYPVDSVYEASRVNGTYSYKEIQVWLFF